MKEIWDKKAATFPRYGQFGDEDKPIFDYFDNVGIQLNDKYIIDLGCGNGRYALALAQKARFLYALDISQNMLDNLTKDAQTHNIFNVKTICADWEECDVNTFTNPIDIIFASLTPALNSFEKFKKAYDLAREWIMYIGWGRRRENEFLSEVFNAHNTSVILPKGAPDVVEYLAEMNKEIPPIHYITKTITHKKTLQDAINDAALQLEMHDTAPNLQIIESIATQWKEKHSDIVIYTSIMELGLMAIRK